MNHSAIVLVVAVTLQSIAALMALRLHWASVRRGAWWLIAAAFMLMAVRGILDLQRMFGPATADPALANLVGISSVWVSLVVSCVTLCGVAILGPIFRGMACSQSVLRKERDELQDAAEEAEIERQMARQIQQALLPVDTVRWKSLEVAGHCTFIKETGGDLFDFIPVSDEAALVYIADVSGHGLGPAMIASEVRAYIRALAEAGHSNPAAILNQLNHFLAENAGGHFVTIFLAKLNPVAGRIVYASAGHPGWLLDELGQVTKLESQSIPLGIDTKSNLGSACSMPLPAGAILLLATDGLYEAYSPSTGTFGIGHAAEVVYANRNQDGRTIVDRLQREVGIFSQAQLHDDVTTVVVKRLPEIESSTAGRKPLASFATVD